MNQTAQEEPKEAQVNEIENDRKSSKYPNFFDLAAIYGVFVLAQFVGVIAAKIILPHISLSMGESQQKGWIMLISQVVAMSLQLIFMTFLRRSRSAKRPKLRFSLKGLDPALLLGGFVMILTTSIVVEPLLSLMPMPSPVEGRGWPMMLAVVVGAPIFEEIICRGLIFESLLSKWGMFVAWIVSSLFFGLLHLQPAMIVNAFFMGLILCYFYIRTRSLWAPIILHSLNNSVAYIAILLGFGGNLLLRDMVPNTTLYTILYVASALLLLCATIFCVRKFRRIAKEHEVSEVWKQSDIIDGEKETLQ